MVGLARGGDLALNCDPQLCATVADQGAARTPLVWLASLAPAGNTGSPVR